MRRRISDTERVPDELLVFDGREHTTAAEWEAAYGAWFDARRVWQENHPGQELTCTVLSDCPFDPDSI
jgi:hypothetical protein